MVESQGRLNETGGAHTQVEEAPGDADTTKPANNREMMLAAGQSRGISGQAADALDLASEKADIEKLWSGMSRESRNRVSNFVSDYYQAAKEAAGNSGIKPEFILALTALESGFGTSRAATEGGNFFGASVSRTGDDRLLLDEGGFKEGAERFVPDWRHQLNGFELDPSEQHPPATIEEFVDRLTNGRRVYNELGRHGQGDPGWKDKVKNLYYEVMGAINHPEAEPESLEGRR